MSEVSSSAGRLTYVTYLLPGLLFPEEISRQVAERDVAAAVREAPESAFAFRFHDVITASALGEVVRSRAIEVSGTYYIDAERLSVDDVRALPGDNRVLLRNMEGNGWGVMLRCRTGNFRPLVPGDEVVSSRG